MGDSAGELTNGFHLLRLSELFLERSLLGNVFKNTENTLLSRNVDQLGRIQRRPLFTRLGAKSDFQVANRSVFVESFQERGPILGPLPKLKFERCATNHLLSPVSGNTKKTFVHIHVPALRCSSDSRGFWARVERLVESLLCLFALGNIENYA